MDNMGCSNKVVDMERSMDYSMDHMLDTDYIYNRNHTLGSDLDDTHTSEHDIHISEYDMLAAYNGNHYAAA